MVLGRTHRAQIRFPIHFTAPDRSRTYIGETVDVSSTGFSVEVRTEDPLPPIILAGILPTQIAGDAILCKARVVWQGGISRGIGRASYKITSIAQKSQERLDQLIQKSLQKLMEEIQSLPPFSATDAGDLEILLAFSRTREVSSGRRIYSAGDERGKGIYILLGGEARLQGGELDGRTFSIGSVIGSWSEPDPVLNDQTATATSDVRALHLPLALVGELEARAPVLATLLEEAIGKPATPPTRAPVKRAHRMRIDMPRELQEIPTLPSVFNAVMDCVEDPDATPRDLAEIIRQDQSLTAKLLKTVNSALYGFARRIESVNDAVVLLGIRETANLAITALLLNTLTDDENPDQRPERFWEHSLGSAYFAQAIGRTLKAKQRAGKLQAVKIGQRAGNKKEADVPTRTRDGQPDEGTQAVAERSRTLDVDRLFTYAILHDIGLVVLSLKFPDHFTLVQEAIARTRDLHRAELELLEVDHCQLGYRIAKAWRLPEPIPTIIAEHHLPQVWIDEISERERLLELMLEDPTVTVISLADMMARHCEIGVELDPEPPEIPALLWEAIGLEEGDVKAILEHGEDYREKAESFFRGACESC